jgi:uncharacterized protein (UPF0276 family)
MIRSAMTPLPSNLGVAVRRQFAAELLRSERHIDWIEIVPEEWMDPGVRTARLLHELDERWMIVPHARSLSIGDVASIDRSLVAGIDALCARIDAPYWSDHVCYGRVGEIFLPLSFTDATIEHVAARVRELRRLTDRPLVLENPTYFARMPGSTLKEPEFLRMLWEEADCGVLLDINNLYVNSQNHAYDPCDFVDGLRMQRVAQLHIAGHTSVENAQRARVLDEVWQLYEYTIARAGRVIPTIVEWDEEAPHIDRLLDELDRARHHAGVALAAAGRTALG